jgi:outer membrane protein assembly factor BamB
MRRALLVRAAASAAFALVAGCFGSEGSVARVQPEVPLWYRHDGHALEVVFREALTARERSENPAAEKGQPAFDPAGARLFVGSSDSGVYAVDARSGAVRWRFQTAGMVQSEVLFDATRDLVFAGDNDGALYALRAADGALAWRFQTGGPIVRHPVVAGDRVIFTNEADQVFCVEIGSGKVLWQKARPPAAGTEIAGHAGAALVGDRVFTSSSDGMALAYDAYTGSEAWEGIDLNADADLASAKDATKYLDADATPVSMRLPTGVTAVYFAGYGGGVQAVDAVDGRRLWSFAAAKAVSDLVLWREPAHASKEPDGAAGPEVPERTLLIAVSTISGVWALDPRTGEARWHLAAPKGGVTAPTEVAGALAIGTGRNGLFLVSPRNGRVIDGLDATDGFTARPVAHRYGLFALSNTGALLGLRVTPPSGD